MLDSVVKADVIQALQAIRKELDGIRYEFERLANTADRIALPVEPTVAKPEEKPFLALLAMGELNPDVEWFFSFG